MNFSKMSSFVLAGILDHTEVGARFTLWPLHVTVLPPFEAESKDVLGRLLNPIISQTKPMRVQLGDFSKYGDRVVRQVVPNHELTLLHNKILHAAENQSLQIDGHYTGRHYTPHVTRKAGRDYDGDSFLLDKIYLVESLSQGYRQVVAEYMLGER